MPRKRREGLTTYARYKGKMHRVGMGISGSEEIAKEYAETLTLARASGYGLYKMAYQEVVPKLQELGVSSKLWGLIKAFVNELIHKCQVKKVADPEDVIEAWRSAFKSLDPDMHLDEIADVVIRVVKKGVEKPAPKGA